MTGAGSGPSDPAETPLGFWDQLEEKWPEIVRDLELPRGLLQQLDVMDVDGKLQAVFAWLEERHAEKKLAAAITRALPGDERWEKDVRDALEKVGVWFGWQ